MKKLMIVDDEEDVREFAANFFRKRQVQTKTAASGEEALGLLDEFKPDLILLDIKMAGLDGIETLKRIRQRDKNIKVMMVTGKRPDEDASSQVCNQYGASGYIHKPLELDELEREVIKRLSE